MRQFTMKDATGSTWTRPDWTSLTRNTMTPTGNLRPLRVKVRRSRGALGRDGRPQSQEFMVYSDAGEDLVVSCAHCGYAANLEKATSRLDTVEDYPPAGDGQPAEVHTPGLKTVEEVAKFLGVSPKNKIKTMALMASDPGAPAGKPRWIPVIAYLRGDHTMNEAKFSVAVGSGEFRPMQPEEIQEVFGAPAGFLGPVGGHHREFRGIKAKVLVDRALLGART